MKKILILVICLFFLVGCSDNTSDTQSKDKLTSEIKYFSSHIAKLLNDLNNISLQNYELTSRKVNIDSSSNNSSSSEGSSSSGSSSNSGGQSQSGSGQGSSQNNDQSAESQSITVTDMQANSVLKTNTDDINWDLVKTEIEQINTSWSVVMLDLQNANVSNTDIMAFSNLLDKTIISIKNEDKNTSLTNLTALYSYIPKFLNSVSMDKSLQNIETTKYNIFIAYAAVSQDDWNTANTNIANAESTFLSVLNDTDYSKNREFKINKTYVLLKDIQNSIVNMDKELFFLKYKNLMESLNTL